MEKAFIYARAIMLKYCNNVNTANTVNCQAFYNYQSREIKRVWNCIVWRQECDACMQEKCTLNAIKKCQ